MEFTAADTVQDFHPIPSSLRKLRRTKTGSKVIFFIGSEIVIIHIIQHKTITNCKTNR